MKKKREISIKNIKKRLNKINQREIPELNKKLVIYEKDMKFYKNSLNIIMSNLNKLKNKTPALTMLEINEQRHITDVLTTLRQNIVNVEDRLFTIKTEMIENLQIQIDEIQTLLKPYNYKNSDIVGKMIQNDYPVKPKKKLIVIVAFVTSFILSIFIVFFMQFISSFKEEEKIQK